MNRSAIFGLILISLTPLTLCASDSISSPQNSWAEGQNLYAQGHFDEALQWFESHAPKSTEDPAYDYDLGTIFLQLSKPGLATAYLDKAKTLNPWDSEIRHNLDLARDSLGRLIGPEHVDPASSWEESLADALPLAWIRGGVGLLLVFVFIWVAARPPVTEIGSGEPSRPLWKDPLLWTSCALGALSITLAAVHNSAISHPALICLEDTVVHSGPSDRFMEVARFETGVKLRAVPLPKAVPAPGSWIPVRYSSDGGIGWVKTSSLLLL